LCWSESLRQYCHLVLCILPRMEIWLITTFSSFISLEPHLQPIKMHFIWETLEVHGSLWPSPRLILWSNYKCLLLIPLLSLLIIWNLSWEKVHFSLFFVLSEFGSTFTYYSILPAIYRKKIGIADWLTMDHKLINNL